MCGGVCHGTLFDLPGRECPVAECRDGYPQPAVRAQACDLLLGYREADFHHPDPQQGHGRDARQNRLPRCGLPFADDAREGRVQLAVVEVFAGDAVCRLGLAQSGLCLDPLDLGQAFGVVKLFEARAGIFRLVERRLRGIEGLPGRRRVELGQQLSLLHALPFVRVGAREGSGDGEAQGGRGLLLDRADVERGVDVRRRGDDDGAHPQRIGRMGLFR